MVHDKDQFVDCGVRFRGYVQMKIEFGHLYQGLMCIQFLISENPNRFAASSKLGSELS